MGTSFSPARTTFVRIAVCSLLAIALVGCSKSSGDSSSSTKTGGGSGGSGDSTAGAKLFPDDFVDVCQGAGQSRAKAYGETGPHKAVYIQTYQDKLQDDSQVLPSDWTPQFDADSDAFAAVEVVGCGVRTDEKFIKECTGYQVDGKDTNHKVKLYSGTYEVSAYEAKTGKKLGSTTMKTTDTECPMLQSFDEGEKTATEYQTPTNDEIVAFLKPYIEG